MDITSNPQPKHQCLGLSDACKQYPPQTEILFLQPLRFLEGSRIQSLVRKKRELCRLNLTIHMKHNWSSIRQAAPPPLQSYSVMIQTWGKVAVHTTVNQKGKEGAIFNFSHLKRALTVRDSPRPFPGKEAGTGARTQAPF